MVKQKGGREPSETTSSLREGGGEGAGTTISLSNPGLQEGVKKSGGESSYAKEAQDHYEY